MYKWFQHWWSSPGWISLGLGSLGLGSRAALSSYLDMALPQAEHRKVWNHLQRCDDCRESLSEMSALREELRSIPVPPPPAGLSRAIRMRIADERAAIQRPTLWWRARNRLEPFALPAFSGTAFALVIFALFIPEVAVPSVVYQNDVPIEWATPARLLGTGPAELGLDPENLVVQVLIDHNGRVADYSILAGNYSDEDARELRNRLTFTIFDPATFHGRPTAELRLISFSTVRVRG